ncbi:hypothetical protein CFD26_108434 [Aspergillus turcosus]|uniref:Uncharacterized protein n=1 Tax=Aspergillus turcosus TaxID=1245748 RepID=A0A421DDS3_9EURO|nr:hypothetical protein CFD26_108434 [Aspergillus turcosus]
MHPKTTLQDRLNAASNITTLNGRRRHPRTRKVPAIPIAYSVFSKTINIHIHHPTPPYSSPKYLSAQPSYTTHMHFRRYKGKNEFEMDGAPVLMPTTSITYKPHREILPDDVGRSTASTSLDHIVDFT